MDNKRVLILEDNLALLNSMDMLLSSLGYETYPASDKSTLEQHRYNLIPDIAIVDIHVPGVSEEYICDFIEQSRPSTKVVLFTGDLRAIKSLNCEVDAVLPKPFRINDFEQILEWLY